MLVSESEWCVTAQMDRRNGAKNYISCYSKYISEVTWRPDCKSIDSARNAAVQKRNMKHTTDYTRETRRFENGKCGSAGTKILDYKNERASRVETAQRDWVNNIQAFVHTYINTCIYSMDTKFAKMRVGCGTGPKHNEYTKCAKYMI